MSKAIVLITPKELCELIGVSSVHGSDEHCKEWDNEEGLLLTVQSDDLPRRFDSMSGHVARCTWPELQRALTEGRVADGGAGGLQVSGDDDGKVFITVNVFHGRE